MVQSKRKKPNSKSYLFRPFEIILLSSGALILLSVPLIALFGTFSLWFLAKALYLVGVVTFLVRA